MMFFVMTANGCQHAIVSMIGNLVGEGRPELTLRAYNLIGWYLYIFFFSLSFILWVIREPLSHAFSDSEEVRELWVYCTGYNAIIIALNCASLYNTSPHKAIGRPGI
jgi:Na+-driven multidrug efflux pump